MKVLLEQLVHQDLFWLNITTIAIQVLFIYDGLHILAIPLLMH